MKTETVMSDSEQRLVSPPEQPKREQRQWWAVAEGYVQQVTGYSCAPSTPGYWWCPAVGYSMSETKHLFDTEAEALDCAIMEAEADAVALQKRLDALKARRANSQINEPNS